jgi:hypothetical protein
MSQSAPPSVEAKVRAELETAHAAFHALLDSLPEPDWRKQSLNPGWSNAEILSHMLFGFIIVCVLLPMARSWGRLPPGSSKPFARLLDAVTGPFNWVNALGARMQATVFQPQRIGPAFDIVYQVLRKQVASIHDSEWQTGMYYPTKWDSNFSDFMTLEKLFSYPIVHFNFHRGQIAR